MLHLMFQAGFDSVFLHRMGEGDDIVFFESTIFLLIKGSVLSNELQKVSQRNIRMFVLNSEMETRGINVEEMILGLNVIDYHDLVKLTEENTVIRTWN